MRCTQCGWDNPAGSQKCEKCKSPLAVVSQSNYQEEAGDQNSSFAQAGGIPSTLREGASIGMKTAVCECGYPLATGAKSCPQCGKRLDGGNTPPVSSSSDSNKVKCPKCNTENSSSQKFCGQCGYPLSEKSTRVGGTIGHCGINVGGINTFFTLKPIAWDGEGINYQPISYSGTSIVLTRSNTDANNNTITSREQAVVTHDKDGWYIENRSDLLTTYIRVSKKIKLEDGDVIMLGNRLFEFKGK